MTERDFSELKCKGYNATEGNLHEVDGYCCNKCNNRGNMMISTRDDYGNYYEVMRRCSCMSIRASLRRLKRSGLKDVIKKYTFSAYVTDTAWRATLKSAAIAFTKDESARCFFIGGQSGAGKSHLGTAICREFLVNDKNVHYMLWMDESKPLKASVNDESYEIEIGKLKAVDVLYIDDFLKTQNGAPPTAGDMNLAIELINARYNSRGKITVISSEFKTGDIVELDEALGGRIIEMCGDTYEFNIRKDREKNWRLRNRKEL